MKRHFISVSVAAVSLLLGSACPSIADLSPGFKDAYSVPSAIRVTLATDRTSYSLRDDIQVRIEFKNTSSESLGFPHLAGPVLDVALTIDDARGVALSPDPHIQLHVGPWSGHSILLDPGVDIVEKSESQEFIPISYWGYRITTPGSYRLKAVLRGSLSSSNTITVTVDP